MRAYSAGCLFEILSGADYGCDYVPHIEVRVIVGGIVSGWRLGGKKDVIYCHFNNGARSGARSWGSSGH